MVKRYFIPLANRNNKFTIFLITFILFSVYAFVFSESGMLERMKLKKEIAYIQLHILQKQAEIQKYRQMADKHNLANLLFKESINAGYVPQGAKVFEFKDRNIKSSRAQSFVPASNEKFTSYIKYGRILWLVFSVLIVAGMLLYYRNRNRL